MNAITRFPGWGSAQVAVLLNFGVECGVSAETLLAGSGISESELALADPTLTQELRVIRNLMASSDLHPFELGFEVGRTCGVNTFGLLGQALAACHTPRQLIAVATEFLKGNHHFLRIHNQVTIRRIHTVFDVPEHLAEDEGYFLLGRDMGAAIVFQDSVLQGRSSTTVEVGFTGPEVPSMAKVGAAYGCEVKYHQRENYLDNSLRALTLVMPMGNRYLSNVLVKRLRHFFSSRPAVGSDGQKIHQDIVLLLDQVGYAEMSKEQMASLLNMSPRTLSRYLEKEGTTWRVFYNRLRMEKAQQLLCHTDSNLETIAESLGFSSASAFSSAFSRTLGKSPQQYRQSQCAVATLD